MRDLRSRWNLVVVILALSALVGCGALQADPRTAQQNQRDTDGLWVNGRVLNFGEVVVGNRSQAVEYIYNPTSSSVTVNGATTSARDFQVSSPTFPVTLAPRKGFALSVTYTPSTLGRTSATILVSSNAAQPSLTVPVYGQAVSAGKLVVAPSTVSFGNVQVGKSESQAGSFTNSGGTSITVSQVTTSSSDFAVGGLALPVTLQPNQKVNFHVMFAPKASGARSGNVTANAAASLVAPSSSVQFSTQSVTQSAQTSQSEVATIAVAGTGTQSTGSDTTLGQLTAAPASLSFGSPLVGSKQTLPLVITNTGSASVTVTQAAATGAGYSLTAPGLPLTIAGNQTASFSVTFTPQSAGNASGNVSIVSNAANPSLNVALTGTPVTPGVLTVSSNPVSFGTVPVGTSQKTSATVTNSGGSIVTLTQATVSGTGFSMNTMGMPMTLAPNQSANVSITCAPQSAGTLSGSLAITSNASNANVAVPLTATAVAPGTLTVTPSSLSFGSVTSGTTQSLPAILTNSGGTSVNVTQATFSGSGYSTTGLSLPVTLQRARALPSMWFLRRKRRATITSTSPLAATLLIPP